MMTPAEMRNKAMQQFDICLHENANNHLFKKGIHY